MQLFLSCLRDNNFVILRNRTSALFYTIVKVLQHTVKWSSEKKTLFSMLFNRLKL